jgi:hypothetical protein
MVAARKGDVSRPWIPVAAAVAAAAILSAIPMAGWPGRFTISTLEAAERYGATLKAAAGVPSVEAITAAVALMPAALAGAAIARTRVGLALAIALYILSAIVVYGILRLTMAAAASQAEAEGFASRLSLYPVEALLAMALLAAIAARRYTTKG